MHISAKSDYAVRAMVILAAPEVVLPEGLRTVLENVSLHDVASGQLPEAVTSLNSDPDSWVPR